MTTAFLFAIVAFLFCSTELAAQKYAPDTLYCASQTGKKWTLSPEVGGVACARVVDNLKTTGWYILNVETQAAFDMQPDSQAYGAGFLEGALTQPQIWNAYKNTVNGTSTNVPAAVRTFASQNQLWLESQAAAYKDASPYWMQIHYHLLQVHGLWEGYTSALPSQAEQISYDDFIMYQLQWELGDIQSAVKLAGKICYTDAVSNEIACTVYKDVANSCIKDMAEHCSVLIKPVLDSNGAYSQLLASHVTWSGFSSMLRMYKHMDLSYRPVKGVSFSSFPGCMASGDDFYVTTAKLQIMETTNSVYNQTVYQATTVQTVPYYLRVSVANSLSTTGKAWMDSFGLFNSGTYNNQWQVIDYKLFSAGQSTINSNTLWIGEQIPGMWLARDQSQRLQSDNYFASYNVPFYKEIWYASGYAPCYKDKGNECSWSMCARAQIFRRDNANVRNTHDLKRIMRYNNYQNDELSLRDACRGISARCDLNAPWNGINGNTLNGMAAFGAIDAKVCNDQLILLRQSDAVCGPSWDTQPVFAWTNQWKYQPHFGHPDVFNFEFTIMSPERLSYARVRMYIIHIYHTYTYILYCT